jgi:hypothetical protein
VHVFLLIEFRLLNSQNKDRSGNQKKFKSISIDIANNARAEIGINNFIIIEFLMSVYKIQEDPHQ